MFKSELAPFSNGRVLISGYELSDVFSFLRPLEKCKSTLKFHRVTS